MEQVSIFSRLLQLFRNILVSEKAFCMQVNVNDFSATPFIIP